MYHPLHFRIIAAFVSLIVIPFATSLSFNFSSFGPNSHGIIYEQSAYAINNVIQLTQQPSNALTTDGRTGRVNYAQPFHLWDKASENLSDFSAKFSFSMIHNTNDQQLTGWSQLSFFFVPNGTNGNFNLTTFVAVEFALSAHTNTNGVIYININNNKTQTSLLLVDGWNHKVSITYDSISKNLSVFGTGLWNGYQISGTISRAVDLRLHLPEFVTLGFLATPAQSLETIRSWSFDSTELESKSSNRTDSKGLTTPVLNSRKSNNNNGLFIGLAIGVTVFVLLLMGLLTYCFWSKVKMMVNGVRGAIPAPKDDELDGTIPAPNDDELDGTIRDQLDDELEQGSGPKQYGYEALKNATDNFAVENKLGEGGFGIVYKGILTGKATAVKRISSDSKQGVKEYLSEVKIISRLRHRNLVQLLGWCHEKNELLLVYEFLSQGILDLHLFKGRSLLSWGTRYKIAQGLAAALLYLHEECDQCVLHRDIKSSNIMLNDDFTTKLGDFGLARLVDHGMKSKTTDMAGTFGYMAPECTITGISSKETDVFSFGVIALEIASGRRPMYLEAKQGRPNLIEWVWSLYGTEKLLDAADPRLGTEFNSRELEQLLIVGLWCVHPNSDSRPSIKQAGLVLEFEAPLPILPLKMPVPRYYTSESDVMVPNGSNGQSVLSDTTESSSVCTVAGTSSS